MAMRDLYAAWFAWCAIRITDGRIHDLWGSAFCLTAAVDFVGVDDAAGGGGHDAYLSAASEGLTCLSGMAAKQVLRDMVVSCAFMKAKDEMAARSAVIPDLDGFISAAGGPATPVELIRARWWDGAIPYIHRSIMSTLGYRHLADDDLGTFGAADRCMKIKRAIDNMLRYDEIVDLVPDYMRDECLNEVCHALAVGGVHAVSGYANACTRAVDDALDCDCGQDGHEEAAEIAMGTALYFLLCPRYVSRGQLASYSAFGEPITSAFDWPTAGTRLRPIADTVLKPGTTLHSPFWDPLWSHTDALQAPGIPPAEELARRATKRSLSGPASEDAIRSCEAAAHSVLVDCDRLTDPASLRALAEPWCRFFDAVVNARITDGVTCQQASTELRPLIARIWQQAVVVSNNLPAAAEDRADERLFMDIDHAIRRTYSLADPDAFAVRRAFLGVATSAVELSGLNPYNRLADGPARMVLRHQQEVR